MHDETSIWRAKARWTVGRQLVLTLGGAILGVIVVASMLLVLRSYADNGLFARTLELENKIASLQILVSRAESAQRGYLLTGIPDYLDAYRSSADAVIPALSDLKAATADSPWAQQAFGGLETAVLAKVAELRDVIRRYGDGDRDAALERVQGDQDRALTREISTTLDAMTVETERQLDIQRSDSERANFWLVNTRRAGVAVIVVLVAVLALIVRRANRDREAALRSLATANARLEATVAERTAHLHQANEEIRRSAEVLDNTITSMADGVVVFDQSRKALLVNPAATRLLAMSSGMSADEWRQIYEVFESDEVTPLPAKRGTLERVATGELVDNLEVYVRRIGAAEGIHVVTSGRPLRDAAGGVIGAVLVFHDVTEARRIERRMREVHKMDAIGQLTGGVAHDFNNILTVITGTIDILAKAVAHDDKLAAITRMIDDAAERGSELTRHLLAFARKQPLQPRATDINALLRNTAKLLKPTLGEQIEIETTFQGDAWPTLIDTSQLTAAVLNLALNARDAMPNGGKLTLETRNVYLDEAYAEMNVDVRPGAYVMVAVSDTGLGIPVTIRDKVFEPFFTTKEPGKGTGLGLSMVYGFVKQSGGNIKIYSEEGHGTSIKLYLPRADGDLERVADEALSTPPDLGDETILVVEDDPLVRQYVIAQLTNLGYATLAAGNATEALAVLDRGALVDLLFTDVVMPGGMNGRQLAEAAAERRPGIKVLFTSGYTQNAIVHHGRLDEGVHLLAKPYRKSDLARMVRRALEMAPDGAPA